MTTLTQILGIEKGIAGRAKTALTDAYQLLAKSAPFAGISRVYQPVDEDGLSLPEELTRVQHTVSGLVLGLRGDYIRLLDLGFERDVANTLAKADLVLEDGTVVVLDAPSTYLMWLKHQLDDLKAFAAKWPTLDQAEQWTWDGGLGAWRSSVVKTHRTEKVLKALVKYPHSDKHPAQTETYTKDEIVGFWHRTLFSGAVPPAEKGRVLARIDALYIAVTKALAAANEQVVPTDLPKPGSAILDYLFSAE